MKRSYRSSEERREERKRLRDEEKEVLITREKKVRLSFSAKRESSSLPEVIFQPTRIQQLGRK